MLEPFNCDRAHVAGPFARLMHIAPDDPAPEQADAAAAIMTGRVREPWIDRLARPGRYSRRLVKDVSAHLFLGWLARRFPGAQLVLLVRHPLSVALSQRARPHEPRPRSTRDLLAQERLCDTHLADQLAVLEAAEPGLEADLCIWAAQLRVALRELSSDSVHVAFYEALRLDPERSVAELLVALDAAVPGTGAGESLQVALRTPSPTTRPDSPVRRGGGLEEWRDALAPSDRRRARRILEAFGLDALYGDGVLPDRGVVDALLAG